jgi:hypothetical protein
LNVGVLSLVTVPLNGDEIIGASGATVSIVMLTAEEAAEVYPAEFVALAVIL